MSRRRFFSSESAVEAPGEMLDVRPDVIMGDLEFLRPISRRAACYRRSGRDIPEFSWTRNDDVEALKERLS